ncbi:MarR family winged helix-turn-helix transcriptional regulator [Nocardioides nematodiphilus]|jgi:DNA-binding MarR family transcriptional regulator|uniref:MarR family winged helix-turn-helix transcriptional regulator n=1 Tax=Nocardioides nematodiphilus TaxID=2849669 RepID=UPI001CDA0966|nr:MarR family transcriptional regulator [Nocardioides nematodiphilus]MCA1981374.1 MarR family transcriptional regulator [Nocardioides nematodiphilus]
MTERTISDDAGLASELRLSVMRLRRRLVGERDPENELSIGSMAVLAGLEVNGDMTLGALAQRERVQPPSMTRTVNCLEEGGYISRLPSETDRRQVVISLTDKGLRTVHADRARRTEWLARRLGELTDTERATLRAAAPILERIANE